MAGTTFEFREDELAAQVEAAYGTSPCAVAGTDMFKHTSGFGDIKPDLQWVGLSCSPTKVHRIQSIVLTASGFTKVEPTTEGISNLVHELIEDHTIG